jgi:large subunit ribosomal protein L13
MKTAFIRPTKKFDATDISLGRLATKVALALRGKDEPEFLPHVDHGAIVEVSNIKKMSLSGKKIDQKVYHSYSGYPGGLKTKKVKDVLAKDAGEVLWRAVREMLPNNKLRQPMLKRLIIK